MSEHVVDVSWSRGEHEFTYDTYSRDHEWRFDGGITLPASANPKYLGTPGPVDPEEAFVAALSSCHMLTHVTLHPKIVWAGPEPDAETLERLHHRAHVECFIANSVTTSVTVA